MSEWDVLIQRSLGGTATTVQNAHIELLPQAELSYNYRLVYFPGEFRAREPCASQQKSVILGLEALGNKENNYKRGFRVFVSYRSSD